MISREEIEHLAQLKSDSGIVSAYIGIRPRLMYKRKHPVTLAKGAFARAERKLHEGSWKEALAREGEKIVDFLNGWDVRGRGLVIFSSQPAGIWEVLTLEVPVPTVVDIDRTTKTGVLTRLLDEHPRLAVALIQRDEAKIYVSEQRISDQAAEVMSHVPGQHDQGGWAQARFERHIEFHMAEHLTKVVDELNQLDRARPFKWLVIGSTEKMAGEFLGMVPDAVARKVIGTFAVDFKHESEKEILERARKAYEEHERRTEFQLVHQVADLSRAAARKATMGITETLRAVAENRVLTLVTTEDLVIEGFVCADCDYFDEKNFSSCPLCHGKPLQQDISDRAVEKAFLAGAHIETVYGEASDRLKAEGGGIGALLRF